MEFLGDAILAVVCCERFTRATRIQEGDMTK